MLAPMVSIIPGCFLVTGNRPIQSHGAPRFSRPRKISMSTSSEIGFPLPPDTRFDSGCLATFRMRIFFFLSTQGHSIPIPLRGFEPPLPTFDPKSRACFYRSRSPRNRRTLNRKRATMQNSVNLVYFQPGLTMWGPGTDLLVDPTPSTARPTRHLL